MKKILIIDDGRLMCFGLRKALHQENMQVDTASSIDEALQLLGMNSYDLCLVDNRFPSDLEFKIIKIIRRKWPTIKIIQMTASDITNEKNLEVLIKKAKENGICHILCKPFDLVQLKEIVSYTLDGDGSDSWYTENFIINDARRNTQRRTWNKKFHFFMSRIKDGQVKREVYPAESLNINENGVVIITPCTLKPTQVISFDETLEKKSGVVVWSDVLDDELYKAGIRFAN